MKRFLALCLSCLIMTGLFSSVAFGADDASSKMSIGFGSVANLREGPGVDETETQVYTINYTFVMALFDADGKIIDSESDILEIATPNYEGKSMPLLSGWPGSKGYNTFDHSTESIKAPTPVTEESITAEISEWKTKRERGDSYGMNPDNDWTPQMDFYEEWFKGKTVAEIKEWFDKYTTSAGRPIKPTTKNEVDIAKLSKFTEAELADLADVLSGATMSLQDPHGYTLDALQNAYDNRIPVKSKDVASLGLGVDRNFRVGPGKDEDGNQIYSFNIVTSGVAFDSKGVVAATISDILEVSTPNYDGASMPHFLGWPGTEAYYVFDHEKNEIISPESSEGISYTVVENDMLWKVAKAHDTTIESILGLNPQITNKDLIYVGDVLNISGESKTLVDLEDSKATISAWETKRARGDAYGMNADNDWYKQMDFYQNWMVGKTVAEISEWFEKYSTTAGRPIKADTKNETDKAKFDKLTDAEKEQLADVVSGATMSIEDSHGKIVTAMDIAYQNAKPIK